MAENFSEKPPARQRGRPRRFEDRAYEPEQSRNLSRAHTERSRLNNVYFKNALILLTQDHPDRHRYAWLCPQDAQLALSPVGRLMPALVPKVKTVLLTELGRIRADYGEATMRHGALQLCEEKPKTRTAVQWLRRWRLQQEPRMGNPGDLYDAIVRTMQDYFDRYPATPPEMFGLVLGGLYTKWEETQDDPPAAPHHPAGAVWRGLRRINSMSKDVKYPTLCP